jgi:hypothetical protein
VAGATALVSEAVCDRLANAIVSGLDRVVVAEAARHDEACASQSKRVGTKARSEMRGIGRNGMRERPTGDAERLEQAARLVRQA